MPLTSCSTCREVVDAAACRCPHCDATLRVCRSASPFAGALLGLALVGCPTPQPDYGIPITDDDGDGYYEDDCDDDNAAVNPGAVEDPTNGIDDDCDGLVDESDG